MIHWRIILKGLQEVKGLVDLVIGEFIKLKRKKITICTALAACMFPIPVALIVIANSYDMKNIFAMMVQLGDCFMMPLMLGMFAMIFFYMEQDFDTMKNMRLIPVSMGKWLCAKLIVIALVSVLYSIVSIFASFLIGLAAKDISGIWSNFIIHMLIGFLMCAALLPIIALIINQKNNYIVTGILVFIFVIFNFIFIMSITKIPVWALPFLPIAAVYRFLLPYTAVKMTIYLEEIALSGLQFVGAMFCTVFISVIFIIYGFHKKYSR